jgi:hypothetical protein
MMLLYSIEGDRTAIYRDMEMELDLARAKGALSTSNS